MSITGFPCDARYGQSRDRWRTNGATCDERREKKIGGKQNVGVASVRSTVVIGWPQRINRFFFHFSGIVKIFVLGICLSGWNVIYWFGNFFPRVSWKFFLNFVLFVRLRSDVTETWFDVTWIFLEDKTAGYESVKSIQVAHIQRQRIGHANEYANEVNWPAMAIQG